MTLRRIRAASALAAVVLWLSAGPLPASETRIWLLDSASDFSTGEARGVSVTGDGTLALARGLEAVSGVSAAAIYAGARGSDGALYLGTGEEGKILRVAGPKSEVAATLPEKQVTALAVGPDGAIYAGASPGGRIYRVAGGSADVYFETKAKYVWALAFDGKTLLAATGLPGEIYRISGVKKGERIYASTDAHVRSLFVDAQGRLWAGTSGSGLVLRIDRSGTVSTMYDSSKTEISSITASADGRIWVAAVSGEAAAGGGESITAPVTLPAGKPSHASGEGDEKDKPEVSVSVSSPRVAPSHPGGKGNYSSEIVAFPEDEPPRSVWTSSEELVFALEPFGARDVVAATGPNGKLYRVGAGRWSLDRTLDEKQISVLTGDAIATNGSCAVYRLSDGARKGEYVSAVKDTGRTSRFGAFRWEGDVPAGAQAEFAFRSGESQIPDPTWSSWSAWASGEAASKVAAPPGRYLQWKLRLSSNGSGKAIPSVRRVEAAYRNRNAAPDVESVSAMAPGEVLARAVSGSQNVFESQAPDEKGIFTGLEEAKAEGAPRKLIRKGYRTLTWRASDRDGDPLRYEIRVRPAGSDRWVLLRKDVRETFYAFDTTSLPDGDYVFRVAASDADANPDDPKTAERDSSPVRVDNTPPVIRRLGSGTPLRFEAADAASPIQEAEYSVDAKEWVHLEPEDGLSDSPTETYSVKLDGAARGAYVLVRVTDASRNVAVSSFTLP
ncbi:MAG TPA: two-component regulator propeller domain-containing protein [Thermoanaerobaculia bacterium]|nr:two-component regulator propeller domain-containing protein [Thermoanaerobaculia bacterium]